jgi:hypothetical protein
MAIDKLFLVKRGFARSLNAHKQYQLHCTPGAEPTLIFDSLCGAKCGQTFPPMQKKWE